MRFKQTSRMLLVLGFGLLLMACGDDKGQVSDLHTFIDSVKTDTVAKNDISSQPLKLADAISFNARGRHQTNPFTLTARGTTAGASGHVSITSYPVEELKFEGTIILDGKKRAVIAIPPGRAYSLTVGSRVGNNRGEIMSISKHRVKIVEPIDDPAGSSHSRTVILEHKG